MLEDEVDPARLPRLEVARACHSTLKVNARRKCISQSRLY